MDPSEITTVSTNPPESSRLTLDSSKSEPSEHDSVANAEVFVDTKEPATTSVMGGNPVGSSIQLQPLRKRSDSLDDLTDPRPHQHLSDSSSEESAGHPQMATRTLANEPVRWTPRYGSTPRDIDILSFVFVPRVFSYPLPPPTFQLHNYFHIHGTQAQRDWQRQTSNLPPGITTTADDGMYVRDSCHSSQSGHSYEQGVSEVLPPPPRPAMEMQSLAVQELQRIQDEQATTGGKKSGWRKCFDCFCGDLESEEDECAVPARSHCL